MTPLREEMVRIVSAGVFNQRTMGEIGDRLVAIVEARIAVVVVTTSVKTSDGQDVVPVDALREVLR